MGKINGDAARVEMARLRDVSGDLNVRRAKEGNEARGCRGGVKHFIVLYRLWL